MKEKYDQKKAEKVVKEIEELEKSRGDTGRTDAANAEDLIERFGDKIRFRYFQKQWVAFKGQMWVPDSDGAIRWLAIRSARERYREAVDISDAKEKMAEARWAIQSESRSRVEATLLLTRSHSSIEDRGEWDMDDMLLSCPNGIVDLKTGKLRGGKMADRITMTTGIEFDPKAKCPRWLQFLDEIFESNIEVINYVQKALGYSITGSTKEQAAFFCHGSGSNGKSVFFKTIRHVLGDYGHNAPASLLKRKYRDSIPNDVAATNKKRFLVSSEALAVGKMNEELLKGWTGGDKQSARFLNHEFFEFEPTCKPWIFTNHKPTIDDDSHGFWRRVKLISFNREFKENVDDDTELEDKLKKEAKGILAWLVQACLLWQKDGLRPTPEAIASATQDYRAENDPVAEFIHVACDLDETKMTKSSTLYTAYTNWGISEGYLVKEIITRTAFGRRMGNRFEKKDKTAGAFYVGIALKDQKDGGFVENSGTNGGLDPNFQVPPRETSEIERTVKTGLNPPSRHETPKNPPLQGKEEKKPPEASNGLLDKKIMQAQRIFNVGGGEK